MTRKRPHLFRLVLSHSRKAYSEVVWRQTSENFIRCLENAFRHFGGVPQTVVTDNLKAAVIKADWFDPELNAKVEEFGRHYGTVLLPTRPAMPRHRARSSRGSTTGRRTRSRALQSGGAKAWNNSSRSRTTTRASTLRTWRSCGNSNSGMGQ